MIIAFGFAIFANAAAHDHDVGGTLFCVIWSLISIWGSWPEKATPKKGR